MPTTRIRVKKVGDWDFKGKGVKVQFATVVGMRRMIEDIHRTSRPITPMKTGDLRGDVEKTVRKLGSIVRGTIEWKRPYAWYQERGYTSGPVTRYTTEGTGAHFAQLSVRKVTARHKKYFGNKI